MSVGWAIRDDVIEIASGSATRRTDSATSPPGPTTKPLHPCWRAAVRPRREIIKPGGGAERDRTANLRVANAALSQLSYGPESVADSARARCAATGDSGPLIPDL